MPGVGKLDDPHQTKSRHSDFYEYIKNSYDERVKKVAKEFKRILVEPYLKDLIKTLQSDSASRPFTEDRIHEAIENVLRSEQESKILELQTKLTKRKAQLHCLHKQMAQYKEQCASIQAQALEQIRHSANQAHSLDKFRSAATQMQVQALQGVDTSATYSQGSKPDPGNACPPAEDQGRIHGDADAKLQDLNASLHQYKWKCEALENRATLAETQLAQTQTQLGAVQQKEQDLLCSLQRAKTSMSMVDAERQRLQELCTSVEAKVAGFVSYEESHDKLVKSLQSELANAQRECQRLQKSVRGNVMRGLRC